LIDYGLFAEETFMDLGETRKNRKTFFHKHLLPLRYSIVNLVYYFKGFTRDAKKYLFI